MYMVDSWIKNKYTDLIIFNDFFCHTSYFQLKYHKKRVNFAVMTHVP